jgi:ribonuclease R
MEELQQILRKRRDQRGAIDFNFPESKIKCDDEGRAIDVYKEDRRIANRVIEEFMLIANETIAEHFFWMDMPFVYRIHELPNEEKIETFNKFLANFGFFIKMKEGEVHPKAIQILLSKVEGSREEHIINRLMLRSLKQAKYSPLNEGHFGLAAKYYCHFTSPIRRYPDLQIHRIIKECLNGKLSEARIERLKGIVENASLQSSERERLAEKAERDADDMKKAEYMVSHVGETYTGVISSVTSFGFFVELENTVEGLVRMTDLNDDYYYYVDELMQLVGERTKRTIRMGDVVQIIVQRVDVDLREIDFGLVEIVESQDSKPRIEIDDRA